ncbi:major facilitator superfamily domain-containing protein [Crucibulum laeve]|uniref:Lysosomal dipeptide transporter MFSD1 n=1 Tax=Crucibulum laeve TaxID=68775 RepID=A0A5C3M8V3_9AGAR|nr:major facilitator superfamily domain-containing protein [Crucibulum laeve]
MSDSDSDHEPAEPEGILGQEDCDEVDLEHFPTVSIPQPPPSPTLRRRAFFIRTLALLCACSLSIGSHYASYILGPLKSRLGRELGTSHTEFSLLISAYSLNSTWTPLVGGILASRLGTTVTSILATGVILLGQALLLLGDIWGNVRLMTLGLFVFGLGVSPLAVVQETIIVRFFKSHGLGVSMAFGLIAGKGASFISARTTYPLTEKFGGRAPFYVATSLAAFSVIINLVYISSSKWLIQESGAELEAPDIAEEARRRSISNMSEAQALEKVAAKRRVNFRQMTKLGDVFWAYIGLNVLCGMIWSPFTHLAANIIEKRYMLSEESAANQASYLLAGSLILYPICGFLVDRMKHRPIVIQLLLLSSTLTMIAYAWFAAPPSWTQSPTPGIAAFASGHGFSPLLLVVLVPKIVPLKYVSTALGAHKSLEQTGSTIFQTLAGLSLDNDMKHKDLDHKNYKPSKPNTVGVQHLLNVFLFLNVLQFLSILWLAYFQRRKNRAALHHARAGSTDVLEAGVGQLGQRPSEMPNAQQPLLGTDNHQRYSSTDASRSRSRTRPPHDEHKSRSEVRRGEICASVCGILILSAWILFFGTAWFRLGSRKGVH